MNLYSASTTAPHVENTANTVTLVHMRNRQVSRTTPPTDIDAARRMARLRARDAAGIWGINADTFIRKCNQKPCPVPSAVKLGKCWYVTPQGMDKIFDKRQGW